MSKHHESHAAMEKFVDEHLRELCAELVEWQDTGLLRRGRLRELAALCTFDPDGHIRQAERMTERAAIRAIADDGARVTDIMVREALAHCPFDLTPPARWEWIAEKLNAYMADPSQIDRDDAESAARVAALMAAGETSDAAREGGAS